MCILHLFLFHLFIHPFILSFFLSLVHLFISSRSHSFLGSFLHSLVHFLWLYILNHSLFIPLLCTPHGVWLGACLWLSMAVLSVSVCLSVPAYVCVTEYLRV